MKTEQPQSTPRGRLMAMALTAALGGVLCVAGSGCANSFGQSSGSGGYQPANNFSWSPVMPATIKRVLILPLVCPAGSDDLLQGRTTLEPVLFSELGKTKRFELLSADPELLRTRTGRSEWTAEESLPQDFFSSLVRLYDCDAVLFCQLTVFRGYQPLAVGWRMRLVDSHTHNTLWAVDEVFDAGQPRVISSACRYQKAEQLDTADPKAQWAILNSPRQFGQYAAASVLATLPQR